MTEKPCGRCKKVLPIEKFRVKNKDRGTYQSYCIECNKEKNREHYRDNKDLYKSKAREWEASRGGKQAYRHTLTETRLLELMSKYDGKCWCCKERPATVVDHDHSCCSGYITCGNCVRGVLCKACNTGIGNLGDTIEGVNNALEYLSYG